MLLFMAPSPMKGQAFGNSISSSSQMRFDEQGQFPFKPEFVPQILNLKVFLCQPFLHQHGNVPNCIQWKSAKPRRPLYTEGTTMFLQSHVVFGHGSIVCLAPCSETCGFGDIFCSLVFHHFHFFHHVGSRYVQHDFARWLPKPIQFAVV